MLNYSRSIPAEFLTHLFALFVEKLNLNSFIPTNSPHYSRHAKTSFPSVDSLFTVTNDLGIYENVKR
jgi:hypothetical protein